jgi:hypothetical protein
MIWAWMANDTYIKQMYFDPLEKKFGLGSLWGREHVDLLYFFIFVIYNVEKGGMTTSRICLGGQMGLTFFPL